MPSRNLAGDSVKMCLSTHFKSFIQTNHFKGIEGWLFSTRCRHCGRKHSCARLQESKAAKKQMLSRKGWAGRLAVRVTPQARLVCLRAGKGADPGRPKRRTSPPRRAKRVENFKPAEHTNDDLDCSSVMSTRGLVEDLWLVAQYIVFMHQRTPIIATFTVPAACLALLAGWGLVAITGALLSHLPWNVQGLGVLAVL